MLSVDEIRQYIEEDKASEKKKRAEEGVRYYEGEHDILKKHIFYVDGNGDVQEETLRSNVRIPHQFFTELVDQEVQYLLSGKDPFIRSDDSKLQEELNKRFNDNEEFIAELHEILTGAVVKGFEYAYLYKNEENKTVLQCADSIGVVEVRAKDTQQQCDYLIYWYVDRIEKNTKKIKRIEVWDSTQTYFYCQVDDGEITLDESQPHNPRPHTLYGKEQGRGKGKTYYDSYGFIPFLRLDNCRKQHSGLRPVKRLIDDYDVISCDLSNNINNTNEALYVVTGFDGDDLDVLIENIKAKKHIGLPEGGGVNVQTVDIPVEARKTRMEIDEKNIFRFGMGLDMNALKDSGATVSVAIKAAYSLLDLKANKLEIQLKQFLRKYLKIVLDEINKEQGTDYTQSDIYFDFQREIIINAVENAQIELTEAQRRQVEINILHSLFEKLGDEVTMELIAEQLDLEWAELKNRIPKPEDEMETAMKTLKAASVEGDVIA